MANSSCISVGEAKSLVTAFSVFPVIAMTSYVVTILMIVRVAAHRKFGHRLMLYLAIAGMIRTCSIWSQVVPVDLEQPDDSPLSVREGWNGACVFGGFFSLYASLNVTFIIIWISFYIFAQVLFQKLICIPKREKLGIPLIVLVPLIFTWEPFVTKSYGLGGVTCWIAADSCRNQSVVDGFVEMVAVSLVPHLILRLASLAMIVSSVFVLCRNASKGLLKHKHWLAIKEIMPLIMLPLLDGVLGVGRILADSVGKKVFGGRYDNVISDAVHMCISQMFTLAVPLSLLLQTSFRHDLCKSIYINRRRNGETLVHSRDYGKHVQDEECTGDQETECTGDQTSEKRSEVSRSILGVKHGYAPLP